jgi:hypothetical protein
MTSQIARAVADFIFLGVATVAPGWLYLSALGFRCRYGIDRLFAAVGCSLAYLGTAVMVVAYLGLYTRAVCLILVLGPACGLAYRGRNKVKLWLGRSAWTGLRILPPLRASDAPALLAVGVLLILEFVRAGATPPTQWDAMVTWDKWATEWARRDSILGYAFGGYTQLLPICGSLGYKIMGSWGATLPMETFVFHAYQGVFAVLLALATLRLARLLRASGWVAILFLFGSSVLVTWLTSSYADPLVMLLATLAICILVGGLGGEWSTRTDAQWVVGPMFLAAALAKLTGAEWLVLLLFIAVEVRVFRKSNRPRRFSRSFPGLAMIPAVAGLGLFYGGQLYVENTVDFGKVSPYDNMFSMKTTPVALRGAVNQAAGNRTARVRLGAISRDILDGYSLPQSLRTPFAAMALALTLAGLMVLPFRSIPLFAALYCLYWYEAASYDYRNLLPVFPVLAILPAAGYVRLQRILAGYGPRLILFSRTRHGA